MIETATYRLVPVGEVNPDAVTVGIEPAEDGTSKAAIWWEARAGVEAEETEYDDVAEALAAAEAARALHGLAEVVVVLARPELWQDRWGALRLPAVAREPIGDVRATDLTSPETFELASTIEEERDA